MRAYREHLRECSRHEAAGGLVPAAGRGDADRGGARRQGAQVPAADRGSGARSASIENLFPKITTQVGGRHRFVDQPPILFHVAEPDVEERLHEGLADYRESLPDERRVLLDRYRLEDCALKVVGIGSVGTRCYIGLLFSEEGHPLILQFKEAVRSVLEPYAGAERVRRTRASGSSSDSG